MKTCRTCQQTLPIEQFYAARGCADGRLNRCKQCIIKANLEYRQNNRAVFRERQRKYLAKPSAIEAKEEYRASEHYHKLRRDAVKKRRAERPEIRQAHKLVSKAISNGEMVRRPCFICREGDSVGHHPDYSQPLYVVWLCVKHHALIHALMRECEEQKRITAPHYQLNQQQRTI